MKRLNEKGLCCNLEKSIFAQTSVEHLGPNLSKDEVTNGFKVYAVFMIPPSTNVRTLRCFMVSVQFYTKLLPPYLSTINEPFHKLTRKGQQWIWGKEEQEALERLKDLLCTDIYWLTMTCPWNWAFLVMQQKLELRLSFFTTIPMAVREQLPTSQRHG